MTNVWVCGKVTFSEDNTQDWEIKGIFDLEDMAVKGCTTVNDFVAPVPINQLLHETTEVWVGLYYPLDQALEQKH